MVEAIGAQGIPHQGVAVLPVRLSEQPFVLVDGGQVYPDLRGVRRYREGTYREDQVVMPVGIPSDDSEGSEQRNQRRSRHEAGAPGTPPNHSSSPQIG